MTELIIRNARIVTPTATVHGTLRACDGVIEQIALERPTRDGDSTDIDLDGDYLLPGLVELHTDSLEKHLTPRPGVLWPEPLAPTLAHDAALAGCGILTVLDAICAEAFPRQELQRKLFHDAVQAVITGEKLGLFRTRHFLHLRCETADPEVLRLVTPYIDSPLVRMVSLMDHTPGQRQYRNLDKYREYYGSEGWTDSEFEEVLASRRGYQQRYAGRHRTRIMEMCRERGILLATHDDTTREHVQQAVEEGARISEFPTTLEAALEARKAGIRTLMGAPNLLLGHSHAGNVSVREVIAAKALDILSSDYAPCSLLAAPFELQTMGMPLHRGVAMVSSTPADAIGLTGLGRLMPGARADLLRVRVVENTPVVLAAWKDGMRV